MTLSKDLLTGLIYIALAVGGLIVNGRHPLGSISNMGPGYFPMLMFVILLIIGVALSVYAILKKGEAPRGFAFRPVLFAGGAFIFFALAIKPLGFLVTIFVTVILACLAEPSFRVREIIATASVITALVYAVFILLLGLYIPVLPWPLRG